MGAMRQAHKSNLRPLETTRYGRNRHSPPRTRGHRLCPVAFVAFFARQSDFSMSGWDPGEPIFFSDDDWYRNNQRLTRAVMERYLSRL